MEVESCNSNSDIQQWIAYWVIFTLIGVFELMLADILIWLPFWPYLKLVTTCWLVLPYFSGASYVYQHFAKPCVFLKLQQFRAWFIPSNENYILSSYDFLLAAKQYIEHSGIETLEKYISKVHSCFQSLYLVQSSEGKSRPSNISRMNAEVLLLSSEKKVEKVWTCTPCLVSTTSEPDFMKHIEGRKHKVMEGYGLKIRRRSSNEKLVLDLVPQRTGGVNLNGHTRWCIWDKPDAGWTKLNTDGSLDLENARLGGLLRDYMGNPICAFVSNTTRDGIFSLELWAIWRGLVLAQGHGIKAVWVESDSESVVKVINKEISYPPYAHSCLTHIWKLLKRFEKHRVTHSWREANRAADHLSKMNLCGKDVVLWPKNFPEPLCIIIKEDAEGKLYRRRL
ncbi:hypothetical protein GIB67_026005 [Kingdonia uniflora]|uniref:HVA22-like protein n=1 Tax=Kingdonia uniflora TaxID=39325 RepID=A0A7J7M2N9_9MAGN|nr:hypothetical protein GIB67_026005 [Kingdonia uniflora]